MNNFNYRARDNTGKLVKGVLEAENKEDLAQRLRRMGYAPVAITQAAAGLKLENLSLKLGRIGTMDLVMFNVQLANMLNSGLNIITCLETLAKQTENRRLKEAVGSVARAVESGESFSQALTKHPRIFHRLFVSMVRAGEASGNLDKVLSRYAEFAEAQADLQQKVRGALFYPVVLLIAAILVVVFIISFIIPKFVVIFTRAGIAMPLPTMVLYHSGIFIRQFWHLIILAVLLIVAAIKAYLRSPRGRFLFDRISLQLPVVGPLLRKTCVSRFARTLSTLVGSGVPILQSLEIVREVISNEVLGRIVQQMRDAAEKGEKLAQTLKVSEEFPPDTVQMISIAEETGDLEGMLNKISDFYDRSIGYSIKKLTTVIEPLFLLVIGVIIAFIMTSMLLPMFDMMKLLRR